MVDFEVRRDGTVEDAVYDVDPLSDTANPFGDFCVVKIDDRGGDKFDKYSRGTALEVTINDDGQTFDRFDGYVVEARETEQSGADALEVEAYTFDQFLRRNTVSKDQTGNTIAEALESIVKNDTPVSYVAGNIEVSDPQELTRSYRGEPVEVVLRDLAFKSGNEAFGVNDSREFFFRPRETKHIDRGVDNTQWFNYDIPELGKDAINEVEVFFDDGNESVVIDAPTDKLELQDGLSLPEPGTQREELNRPLVTNIQDAEDIGRQYLQFRNATLSGTVTTFGLYDAEPGDTINITIESRGIDTEFRIAAVEYRWGRDETILTVVERRGDQDKILSRISESVKRQEMETADRDALSSRVITTNAAAIIDVSVDANGIGASDTRFTNLGRDNLVDAIANDDPFDIDFMVVGGSNDNLSRSNTAIQEELNVSGDVQSTSTSFPNAQTVTFSATFPNISNVEEIGLFAFNGVIARAVFDTPQTIDAVDFTLTVKNDDSVDRGVLTNDGQTMVRDYLARNNPTRPDSIGIGSDGTVVSESDSSLSELKTVSLTSVLTQRAESSEDWQNITTQVPDTKPVYVDNGKLKLAQATFLEEAELLGGGQDISDSSYSDGEGKLDLNRIDGNFLNFRFETNYKLPSGDWQVIVRGSKETNNGLGNTFEAFIDNRQVNFSQTFTDTTVEWETLSGNFDLSEGEHTLTISIKAINDDQIKFDIIGVQDTRYNFNLDNTVDGNNNLSGPELFPSDVSVTLDVATDRRDITNGDFESVWDDTSGDQQIAVSGDGSTFETFNNTTSGSFTFSSTTNNITTKFTLDRYGSGALSTPTEGVFGQEVDLWELNINPPTPSQSGIGVANYRGVAPPNSGLNGDTIREVGIKSGNVLLTRHEIAEFTVEQNQRVIINETMRFKGTE
jgi:hypothetical protein